MSGDNKKSIDPAVLAAIITVAGGIIVALITTFANRPAAQPNPTSYPTWTNVPTATITDTPKPTDTVPAGEPSSTPAPDTATPQPTDTPAPPAIGADWVNNCISAVWKPYPASIQVDQKDGCLVQPVDKFYTSGGHLAFTFAERVSGAQVFGLFAQLPSDGTAGLQFHLSDLTKGDVLVGIFPQPDVNSNGMVLRIPASKDLQQQRMLIQTMPGFKTFAQTNGAVVSSSATYDVLFDFNNGNVNVKLKSGQINLGTVPLVSADKWLFVGYQVPNGTSSIKADFFDLAVQKR
jgi:hypothetical protein